MMFESYHESITVLLNLLLLIHSNANPLYLLIYRKKIVRGTLLQRTTDPKNVR